MTGPARAPVGPADRAFRRRWIAANSAAEAGGLGATFAIGYAAAPALETLEGAGILLAAALAVALGTLLEGVVVGAAQGTVLRRRRPDIPLRSWIAATAVGAGVAWLVGMVPSTVMALLADPTATTGAARVASSAPPPAEPGPALQLVLAAVLGLVTGPILGGAQWLVLRRRVPRAARWLAANAAAWAVGMIVIFAGMELVPWDATALARWPVILLVCAVAGAAVGAIHGPVLARMTAEPAETASPGDDTAAGRRTGSRGREP